MRILKTRSFNTWAKELEITDFSLKQAVDEITEGLYEASLGGGIYKKRIAIGQRGKKGGARTIVAFKTHKAAIFLYGFAKNTQSNITKKERDALKMLANIYFGYSENQVNHAIKAEELIEILR